MIGTPAACIAWRARVFDPISSIADGGRADPGEAGRLHRRGEPRVLGQEAVAGMDRLGPRAQSRVEQLLGDEVRLGRRLPAQGECLVGEPGVQRRPVDVGVHRNRGDPEVPEGAEHADGDLASIGHEHFGEHGRILPCE